MKLNFITDNVADGTAGWVVDRLEYTTTANGRYVMHLRNAGMITDDDARALAAGPSFHRREDGRALSSGAEGDGIYLDPNGNGCWYGQGGEAHCNGSSPTNLARSALLAREPLPSVTRISGGEKEEGGSTAGCIDLFFGASPDYQSAFRFPFVCDNLNPDGAQVRYDYCAAAADRSVLVIGAVCVEVPNWWQPDAGLPFDFGGTLDESLLYAPTVYTIQCVLCCPDGAGGLSSDPPTSPGGGTYTCIR